MAVRTGDPMAGGTGRPVRAGDADRDRVAGILGVAFSEGRLSKDEYVDRLEVAFRARTRADLDEVLADLPGQLDPAGPVAVGPVARPMTGLAIAGLVLGWGAVIFGVIVAVIAIVAGTYAATHGMGGMRMP